MTLLEAPDVTAVEAPSYYSLPQLNSWGDGVWRASAACKGAPSQDFFPERKPGVDMASMSARAKLVCVQCPVRFECLRFAVENNLIYGLYGGIAPTDRRGMTVDNIRPEDVLVPLHKVVYLARKVYKRDGIRIAANLLGKDVEWVRDTLNNAPDYLV